MNLQQRADAGMAYFSRVNEEVFAGDPAANPRLTVEVLAPSRVAEVDTYVLITPWTLNAVFFADDYPNTLSIGAREYPVFVNELPELGRYGSVNLVSDVSGFESPDRARSAAVALIEPFHTAIREWRAESEVSDPSRRSLLLGKVEPPQD